jgi:phenylpyruvate tautomerase PptA (4-oxalocrotonate tautomerase family)
VITQHEPYELIFQDTGLSLPRSSKLILIHIFQQGRNTEQKQNLYAELAERLEKECQVPQTDLVISVSGNEKEDWSFGMGRAQFLTGEL